MSMGPMSHWWGPVFDAELITRARRWQGYALRSLFVLGLLVGLALVWLELANRSGQISVRQMAAAGTAAFYILTALQLVAVLLVAPAATAGAICLDKARGSLAHVFVTDLTNREIILGKLAARLLPVWGLLACALPVSAMATWLGGIDPVALTGAFVIVVGLAVLGCSFALMLSVWASKPHEVLSLIFGIWVLWLLACPVYQIAYLRGGRPPDWFAWSNPFYLTYAPYNYPGATSLVEPALFALGCLVLGAGCVGVAIGKVRVVGCRSGGVRSGNRGWLGRRLAWLRGKLGEGWGPKLDRDPVLWREWHRNRATRWSKVVWSGFGLISGLACSLIIYYKLARAPGPFINGTHGFVLGLIVTVGLLFVSTSIASVLAEERARGSLDVLMSTPVSTRAILRAKWWGAFRRIPWLIFWPALLGIIFAIVDDLNGTSATTLGLVPVLILAQGAALVSLGLALATWIKRPGQATGWTITGLVFMVVGWPIVGELLPKHRLITNQAGHDLRNNLIQLGLSMGSPFINVTGPYIDAARTFVFVGTEYRRQAVLIHLVAWILIYGLGAWLLFELTVLTFDRCLGRASERPSTPRLEPVGGTRPRRFGVRGWGWRTPGAAGRPVAHAASSEPPPR